MFQHAKLTLNFLQPCEVQEGDTEGSKMTCRMPALILPDDLREQLEQSNNGQIDNTQSPGVAVYWASDRRTRADIYIGLNLGGLKHFRNISFVYPNMKMQFALKPVVSCQSEVLAFNPDADDTIAIQVLSLHW